jgi:FMN phosphatase YigB (HAD superfamily)
MYEKAMNMLHVEPRKAVMVAAHLYDLEAAAAWYVCHNL